MSFLSFTRKRTQKVARRRRNKLIRRNLIKYFNDYAMRDAKLSFLSGNLIKFSLRIYVINKTQLESQLTIIQFTAYFESTRG